MAFSSNRKWFGPLSCARRFSFSRPSERAKVQALNGFSIFGVVVVASVASGWLMHGIGWIGVNLAALPFLTATAIAIGSFMLRGNEMPFDCRPLGELGSAIFSTRFSHERSFRLSTLSLISAPNKTALSRLSQQSHRVPALRCFPAAQPFETMFRSPAEIPTSSSVVAIEWSID